MINWTIVTSIVMGLSLFDLYKAIATYIVYIYKKRRSVKENKDAY